MGDEFKAAREDQATLLGAIEQLKRRLVEPEGGPEPSLGDPVRITPELLEAGKSSRGGWSKAQLAILGVAWPPAAGWKARVIGVSISRADADRFIQLRDGDKQEGPSLF
jgi:hypothetical protein